MINKNQIKSKKKEILFRDDEEDEYLEEDNYFQIDAKNTFSIGDAEESKDKLYKILNDNDDFIVENYEFQKKILSLFYEKIYKTDTDPFNICHLMSKHLMKSLNIKKNIVDEKLDYFINKKKDYKYSKKIELDKENINKLGYILAYSYNKLGGYKINNGKDLKTNIDKAKEDNLKSNIIMLFFNDGNESKTKFCKKNKSKFCVPGTFVFLIDSFIYINTIEINLNFEEEELTKDDVDLFILSILNIQYLFPKINVKINLIHEKLQCSVYRRFYKELFNDTQRGNFKMIYMNKYDVYKKKWDFETEFLLEKHRKNKNNNLEKELEKILNSETLVEEKDKLNDYEICKTPNKEDILSNYFNNSNIKNTDEKKSKNIDIFKSQKINYNIKNEINSHNVSNISNISKNDRQTKPFSNKSLIQYNSNSIFKMDNNPNENIQNLHYDNIIEKFKKSLGLILLTIDSLGYYTNMKRLDLIINDCYQSELQFYLHNYCSSEVKNKFYIVDILITKVRNLEELNLEINILDHKTFNKILSFINYNPALTTLKISFFSSDATYLRQTIYKIYYQNLGSKAISISEIIDMILPRFIDNLEVLFELIKLRDFKKIAVNFDTPSLIEVNNAYMNTIFKFIMNLLFLVDNPNSRIEKLVILSPSTKFDSRFLPSINNILEDINFNENNKLLTELSLHLQLFIIKNIKNLITERLKILNIGDCDIFTFKELTKFLTSYNFSKKSSLEQLSISLLNSIIEYTDEINNIFCKLFSIKIKQLISLNIYTNIYINNEKYFELIDIFKNNWISKYRFIFNPKSEIDINYLNKVKNNNLFYLVSHSLESKLLSNEELVLKNKIFNNKNSIEWDKEDSLYWIMWQIFYHKNKNKIKEKKIKKTTLKDNIFNTLKYFYFYEKVEIIHTLES